MDRALPSGRAIVGANDGNIEPVFGPMNRPANSEADNCWRLRKNGAGPAPVPPVRKAGVRIGQAAAHKGALARSGADEHRALKRVDPKQVIVGASDLVQRLRSQIAQYAVESLPVLVTGDTGVGKERAARLLHDLSLRASGPFIAVNCGALTETLAGADLFGHTRGAFTGAVGERDGAFIAADGGTLFLDEIGELPLTLQAYLLRVLDDGVVVKLGAHSGRRVNVRVVAATNVDLEQCVSKGAFRSDLLFRLDVLRIRVPALRERREDIPLIAADILKTERPAGSRALPISESAQNKLAQQAFPGNIRELRNILARAAVAAAHDGSSEITESHLHLPNGAGGHHADIAATQLNMSEAKKKVERYIALSALATAGGNVSKAATLTGRTRATLHALIRDVDLGALQSELAGVHRELKQLIGDV